MPFGFQFEKNAINNFLNSLQYPLNKTQLIEMAKDRDMPLTVISLLQRLPDHEFTSADEVNHESDGQGVRGR